MNVNHTPYTLHPDRLFSSDSKERDISRQLYNSVKALPIISPHGHTDPKWFASDAPFKNATELLIIPDHYVFRMLYSQGINLDQLGIARLDGSTENVDYLAVWKIFASHYYLFHGTPSRIWMDYVFCEVFGFDVELNADNAEYFYDTINQALATPAFRPRALLKRFNIELLATTEGATNDLAHHQQIKSLGFNDQVITTFRPDDVVDPQIKGFEKNIQRLSELTGEDTHSWDGYLNALRNRREFFRAHGATATDHGHATARTADLSKAECNALFAKIMSQAATVQEQELFRAQMLTEMAGMSIDDGMVMQLHPGVHRNHNTSIFNTYGADKGCDIPVSSEYVNNLKPLLSKYGNEKNLRLILFTLDEDTYTRELAPLAGHYPSLKLGPAWWFNDSPEGMLRFRHQVTETAGFYNTVGFNDDTRAFLSIPARHDVARRIDCRFLAQLVCQHRISESAAFELAHDLSYRLAKNAYQNCLT
ncbi:glucuronate isomerase [Thalassotalea sp. PLHSN55]|uniref:glucuronate isomerase n=1 Tax=Thalassotalea sp. PLHSN55 TaxID=3435888 RepID=UPI003F841678